MTFGVAFVSQLIKAPYVKLYTILKTTASGDYYEQPQDPEVQPLWLLESTISMSPLTFSCNFAFLTYDEFLYKHFPQRFDHNGAILKILKTIL